MGNEKLIKKINQNSKTDFYFSIDRGCQEEDQRSEDMYNFIKNYPDRSFLYSTRYNSQIGITPIQLCVAIFSGFKDIYVVGLDGQSKADGRHGNENTKEKPSWLSDQESLNNLLMDSPLMKSKDFNNLGLHKDDINCNLLIETRQFVSYWDHINSLSKAYDFNVTNLGENLNYNISSEITKWLKENS